MQMQEPTLAEAAAANPAQLQAYWNAQFTRVNNIRKLVTDYAKHATYGENAGQEQAALEKLKGHNAPLYAALYNGGGVFEEGEDPAQPNLADYA